MARKLKGIRRRREGWEAYVRVAGVLYTQQFPIDKPLGEMLAWRARQKADHDVAEPAAAGSFAEDVATYLARIAAMPTHKQKAAHLELWMRELGRDRPRASITAAEIDAVMQRWLVTPTVIAKGKRGRPSGPEGLAAETVRKRRRSLSSLFVKLDGKLGKNPVKAATPPRAPKAEARGLDYGTIARVIAAMPKVRDHKPGTPALPSLAALRVAVLAYTGLPPGLLAAVEPNDLSLVGSGALRVNPRQKGAGVEARTLPLTADGRAALKAFHAADAYGPFAIQSVNRAFQRAARRAGVTARVTLYDLRHSFGTELYRVTGDLATVARFMLHAPGSPVTARYALGANKAVDVDAARAFSDGVAAARRATLKAAPRAARYRKLAAKLAASDNGRKRNHLRKAS